MEIYKLYSKFGIEWIKLCLWKSQTQLIKWHILAHLVRKQAEACLYLSQASLAISLQGQKKERKKRKGLVLGLAKQSFRLIALQAKLQRHILIGVNLAVTA